MFRRSVLLLVVALGGLLVWTPVWGAAQEGTPPAGGLVLGPSATPSGNSYSDAVYGFTLTWDRSWHRVASSGKNVRLTLTNGTSRISFTAATAFRGDPSTCLAAAVSALKSDPAYKGVRQGKDPQGKPLAGTRENRAWTVYLARHVAAGRTTAVALYLDCRTLRGGAVLLIADEVPQGAFNAQAAALQALLKRLTLPRAGTPVSALPTVAPPAVASPAVASPVASPIASAVASPAACAGVAAWVAATTPRVERTVTIANDLAGISSTTEFASKLPGYAAEFKSLAAAQRSGAVPAAAKAINAQLVDVFTRYANGLTSLLNAANAGDQAGVNQAVAALQQTDTEFQQAVTAGTRLAASCGVPTS